MFESVGIVVDGSAAAPATSWLADWLTDCFVEEEKVLLCLTISFTLPDSFANSSRFLFLVSSSHHSLSIPLVHFIYVLTKPSCFHSATEYRTKSISKFHLTKMARGKKFSTEENPSALFLRGISSSFLAAAAAAAAFVANKRRWAPPKW